jgi:hypothetical protein
VNEAGLRHFPSLRLFLDDDGGDQSETRGREPQGVAAGAGAERTDRQGASRMPTCCRPTTA